MKVCQSDAVAKLSGLRVTGLVLLPLSVAGVMVSFLRGVYLTVGDSESGSTVEVLAGSLGWSTFAEAWGPLVLSVLGAAVGLTCLLVDILRRAMARRAPPASPER